MNRITKLVLALVVCALSITMLSFATYAQDDLTTLAASSSTPSKVTSLKFDQADNESLTITWPQVSNASGYELYVSTNGVEFTLLNKGTAATYTYNNIVSNYTYQFKVVAYNGSTYGEYSNIFAYSIYSTIEIFDLEVTDVAATSANISWSAISGATYSVEIYELGVWKVLTSDLTTASYTLSDLEGETAYKVRVSATVGISTSEYVETSFETSTVLSWSSVSGATKYIVTEYDSSDNSWDTIDTTTNTYYPIDTSTDEATSTVYRIYALASGTSTSNAISYETIMKTSSSLDVEYGDTSTTISWPAVSNATLYVVKTKSLDGDTWTTQKTVTTTNATIYLAAQSVQTIVVEAYKGTTLLGNAVDECSIYTPELYIYSLSDIVDGDYSVVSDSLRSQLIYFAQVINNTKYYTGSVSFTSDSYFLSSVTDVTVGGESLGDAMLEDMGMSLDDLTEETKESLSLSFNNGYASSGSKYYQLSSIFVPFDNDAYLYNANMDNVEDLFDGIKKVSSAGENYINILSDGSYEISFEITSEIGLPNYHTGFTTVFQSSDLSDDTFGVSYVNYGATQITATFTAEGLLTSLDVVSPYILNLEASMTDDDGIVKVAMYTTGTTNYSYTFTY